MGLVTRATLLERVAERCVKLGWRRKEIVKEKRVIGHYEVNTRGKKCPGRGWYRWMDQVREEVVRMVEEKQRPPLKELATVARRLSEDTTRDIDGSHVLFPAE